MKTKFPIPLIRVFSIFAVLFIATEILAPIEGVAFTNPVVASFLLIALLVLIIAEKLKEASEALYTDHISKEEKEAYLAKKDDAAIKDWKGLLQALSNTKPIEEESDIILDHDYDGIKELDNDLPPWWVYGFYATIVFAIAYLGYYEVFDGETQVDEYNEQVLIAQQEIEAYRKTVKSVDLNSLEASTDAGALSKGKKIFKQNCAACHMVDGRGAIGPNLTDEYWVLGGGIKNIYKTISEGGRDGKGMIAWKNSLGAEKIQQVANYVWSLQGTNPEKAKAPEGDKWTEE
ncbi:cbb3-type cytochrome c oxidase N-terminal domain-containing protein [Flavicella sediminum]|uniref:cbb3-type cytochrome c oxidase N-terminal domain-containing protein n=1 Tax=Flavicella sediminum TaxID=2585141 RepID=UPI001123E963|nr:cbb3-type cytochrome c oxidase N-terminal domain-containing protein [Flavicella sediminum]